MPCSSSTACRFPDDVLQEANICFSSLPLAECEGLLGMPTSTKVSEPETVCPSRSRVRQPRLVFLLEAALCNRTCASNVRSGPIKKGRTLPRPLKQ